MSTPLVHVSLFSGVGMFDLAMERAGIPTIAACEIDKPARGVISHHWPDLHIFTDVREVTADALRDLGIDPNRTVLSAGWPCQGNSIAGRRNGLDDERSGLWREVARVLAEFRPAWFVGENVPDLLSVNEGRDYGDVLHDLAECGYGVAWRILDAQHFGVPQRRRRLAIVGNRGDNGAAPAQVLLEPEGVPGNPTAGITPGQVAPRRVGGGTDVCGISGTIAHTLTAEGADASEDGTGRGTPVIVAPDVASTLTAGSSGAGISAPGRRQEDDYNLVGYIAETANALTASIGGPDDNDAQAGQLVAFHENSRHELRETEIAGNLTTGGGKPGQGFPAVRDGMIVRRLTPLECERLQGLPDNWTAISDGKPQSDSRRYHQIGNGLAVPVFEWIARRIVAVDGQVAA